VGSRWEISAGLLLEALWDVAEDLPVGRLVECLAEYGAAAFPPGHPTLPRIRFFVDFMAAAGLS
jgi:hypothetical protein